MSDQPTVRSVDRLLLSAETVARILDIDVSSIYKMIADGRLPSVQIEGMSRRRVPWLMLREWTQNLIKSQVAEQESK